MELLNTKEVAQLLKSDKRTIQRKAEQGKYPQGVCGKHGRYWLFNKELLLQHIFKTA
jgi:excisionase family DNA binding protein